MKERPILFSAPMVRVILEGRKTQTRRVVKQQPVGGTTLVEWNTTEKMFVPWNWHTGGYPSGGYRTGKPFACKYGVPGDRLWVRETYRQFYTDGAIYLADAGTHRLNASSEAEAKRMWPGWKPSIHMPRKYSRIDLEVTGVRVERLQVISEADAKAEGVIRNEWSWDDGESPTTDRDGFECVWVAINGRDSWDANPWVWVVEFKRSTA